ncbi:hypothetical protein [Candidatus Palauibacter sp.]|uniref:hypothetical protein n=1 Tax=Candidatus Palauibacter sp. TaxID=3101350 RepID=UPI003AF2348F
MKRYGGRICLAVLGAAVVVAVFTLGDSLMAMNVAEGIAPFRTALVQLGILYVVALFAERSLEVLLKAWRQGGKTRLEEEARSAEQGGKAAAEARLQEYRAGPRGGRSSSV